MKFDSKEIKKLDDITTKFTNVFGMNLNIDMFNIKMPIHLKNNQAIEVDSGFSFDELFKNLKIKISHDFLTKQDYIEIKRIATLYGLNALAVSDIISQIYDENNKNHIDWVLFKKKILIMQNFLLLIKKKKKL